MTCEGAQPFYDSLVTLHEVIAPVFLKFSLSYFIPPRAPSLCPSNNAMAEPFGIASLSIEACKALVSYCDGWRAFDTEIDSVRMKAEGLLSTLQVLDKLLGETSAVRPIITADIALKMSQTGSRIADVCQKVTKCSVIPNSSGVDQKLRKTAKKAKYPFRRDTLKSAANDLQDIQINLNTAFLA